MEIGDVDKDGRLSLEEYKSRCKMHQALRKKCCFLGVCNTGKSCNFAPSNLSFLVR